MRVKFWGARGSIPTPMSEADLREKIKAALYGSVGVDLTDREAVERYVERLPPDVCAIAGGNTSCVEVRIGDKLFILDCGSGIRPLGVQLEHEGFSKNHGEAHIFVTHTHWDHIQGFPFFFPAYVPGNTLHFHSPYPDLEQRLNGQQDEIYYPVPLEYMRAARHWDVLDPTKMTEIAGVEVRLTRLSHPGGSYAYRFDYQGKSVVYATDGEYQRMDEEFTRRYVEFFHDTDLLIFDAQFNFAQVLDEKRDWGHSTPIMGAELAFRANVKRLALTHHDPLSGDESLWKAVTDAESHLVFRARGSDKNLDALPKVLLAREGVSVEL